MSNAIAFDTLAYAKKLKKVGFTEEQAEVQAEALAQIIDERLATKQDIIALKRDINEVKRDIKEMELRLKHDLTLRLGAMLAAGIAIVAALVKLL
jgi:predicted phage-related endonuclease